MTHELLGITTIIIYTMLSGAFWWLAGLAFAEFKEPKLAIATVISAYSATVITAAWALRSIIN